ncbi:MAG TPA: response regulator transcription factor [Steroidobacteraceae bacterium]|jgi:DNA-binding response OmpR family regulator/DNA-binding CsgD family transcriptional regulator|nr:response regulator transcription factor [Steroidobacteraceae bacterium]
MANNNPRHTPDARRDTILVVDDTPETLGFLTDTLDHAGFTALIATDGESALRLIEQITPDLVLMDAVMPGLNGFETCRRMKRNKMLAHLPVIFMTGLTETENVLEGLAAGGVDYVTKPLVVDELLARIRVHLANARVAAGTRAALDATGRFLLAADRSGRLLWCTPKARQLLAELFASDDNNASLPGPVMNQLMQLRSEGVNSRLLVDVNGRKVEISVLSPIGPDELLFRLTELSTTADEQQLQQTLSLTGRESEVLLWISRGKANREIGEILAISPRTVNKHLEQIFVKLGVENRASAAARAVRTLAR